MIIYEQKIYSFILISWLPTNNWQTTVKQIKSFYNTNFELNGRIKIVKFVQLNFLLKTIRSKWDEMKWDEIHSVP